MKMLAVKNFFSSSIIYYNLPQTAADFKLQTWFQSFSRF